MVIAFSNYGLYSIFLSENGGQSWIKVGGNLEASFCGGVSAPSIRWISILPFADGSRKYFCGTSVGLFSADTLLEHTFLEPGTQWKQEAPDLIGNAIVDAISVRPSDGLVVAATHGIGIFSAKFDNSVGTKNAVRAPGVQVWPNPATDVVRFQIEGKNPGFIRLRLFDLQGRLILQKNGNGNFLETDLRSFSNGIYLYALQGAGWQTSGKLIKN